MDRRTVRSLAAARSEATQGVPQLIQVQRRTLGLARHRPDASRLGRALLQLLAAAVHNRREAAAGPAWPVGARQTTTATTPATLGRTVRVKLARAGSLEKTAPLAKRMLAGKVAKAIQVNLEMARAQLEAAAKAALAKQAAAAKQANRACRPKKSRSPSLLPNPPISMPQTAAVRRS